MYEREKREEAPLSRLFSVIISIILIKLTIPSVDVPYDSAGEKLPAVHVGPGDMDELLYDHLRVALTNHHGSQVQMVVMELVGCQQLHL
jgi:hypothetical protein